MTDWHQTSVCLDCDRPREVVSIEFFMDDEEVRGEGCIRWLYCDVCKARGRKGGGLSQHIDKLTPVGCLRVR